MQLKSESSSQINPDEFNQDEQFESAQDELKKLQQQIEKQQKEQVQLFSDLPQDMLQPPSRQQKKLSDIFKKDKYHLAWNTVDIKQDHQYNQLLKDIQVIDQDILELVRSRKQAQSLLQQHISEMRALQQYYRYHEHRYYSVIGQQENRQKQPSVDTKNLNSRITRENIEKIKQISQSSLLAKKQAAQSKNKDLQSEQQLLLQKKKQIGRQIKEIQKQIKNQEKNKKKAWLDNQILAQKQSILQIRNAIKKLQKHLKNI